MLITDTEDHLDLANGTYFFHDNVVMLEVDNMLSGWPTYTLDFTPERPGPLKIILRLKDAVEFRVIEDKDSDDEASGQANSIPQSVAKEDPDATMVCEPMPAPKDSDMPQCISTKPVQLHVIPKNSPSIVHIRKKFEDENDYTWPPRRGFRESSNCTWITQIDALMTIPAAIEALKLD
ncbi:uncharacterized protein F5147DRAFT_647441 [Suillus discolor]|uniref:Uncharacterized protein n=1 Tax=Suillus discolor TaxID=1912936 RepID=A0A9P7FJV0_9AGAM|nr:uncharacterized protein F5147DRAFT_647441 [Suillus discolor]KAG2119487.1 hypothetical protein F5147DRAFT_647441 [Suillus discolor]